MTISNKRYALIAALQAGAAYDFAIIKSRRQFKHDPSEKTAYIPGKLGPSVVATAIKKKYGGIISRKERKEFAIFNGESRARFYNQL